MSQRAVPLQGQESKRPPRPKSKGKAKAKDEKDPEVKGFEEAEGFCRFRDISSFESICYNLAIAHMAP